MLRSRLAFRAACAALALFACPGAGFAGEARVELAPARAPAWRLSRALEALREGARQPRELRIETSPPGARLALAYVREGTELAHAVGVAPLVAILPGTARVGPNDRIALRAELGGFAPAEAMLDLAQLAPSVRLALTPLPGKLLAVSLLELGGRARLVLTSDRALDARLAETQRGVRLVLANVAVEGAVAGRLAALRGATIARAKARAVGPDWVVELTQPPGENRTPRLTRRDASLREASQLALEWLPADRGSAALAAAERALAGAAGDALAPCAAAFERALATSLGDETVARALAPSGAFTDAYVALALGYLAAASPDGALALRDGTRIALDGDAARALAHTRAADVRGALASVRAIAAALAPPGESERALHAWLAPEWSPEGFAAALGGATQAEAACRAAPP
jgi:hypothetical protein